MLLRATNFKSVVSACSTTIPSLLLLVVLDDVLAANVCGARILVSVAACAALAQKIPILIEPHRDRIEALSIVCSQLAALSVLEQVMLLLD